MRVLISIESWKISSVIVYSSVFSFRMVFFVFRWCTVRGTAKVTDTCLFKTRLSPEIHGGSNVQRTVALHQSTCDCWNSSLYFAASSIIGCQFFVYSAPATKMEMKMIAQVTAREMDRRAAQLNSFKIVAFNFVSTVFCLRKLPGRLL